MADVRRLNLPAIKLCLQDTQKNFKKINATLTVRRQPPSDEVINNMMAGYAMIDEFIANDIDLFAYGNSPLLLDLNYAVLYQSTKLSSEEDTCQFEATQNHFYSAETGGIEQLQEWLQLHQHDSIWKRTAGTFTCVLSQPQLFLEGNHRTGSLIMSYLLMRENKAPFVLSYDNAKHFFEPAELTKKRRKRNLVDDLIHLPKQTRKFAKLLKNEQPFMTQLLQG